MTDGVSVFFVVPTSGTVDACPIATVLSKNAVTMHAMQPIRVLLAILMFFSLNRFRRFAELQTCMPFIILKINGNCCWKKFESLLGELRQGQVRADLYQAWALILMEIHWRQDQLSTLRAKTRFVR